MTFTDRVTCQPESRENDGEAAPVIDWDCDPGRVPSRDVVRAAQNISRAVQELPGLILVSGETNAATAADTFEDSRLDTTRALVESASVVGAGAEALANGARSVARGETSLADFASAARTRVVDDVAQLFVVGGNSAFRSAERVANAAASIGDNTVNTAYQGASALVDAGNEALDLLAATGVVSPEQLRSGRQAIAEAGAPLIQGAEALVQQAQGSAIDAQNRAAAAARSAVDRAGEVLPDGLGGFITTAYDSVDFTRRHSGRATNGAADAAQLALQLASRAMRRQQRQ